MFAGSVAYVASELRVSKNQSWRGVAKIGITGGTKIKDILNHDEHVRPLLEECLMQALGIGKLDENAICLSLRKAFEKFRTAVSSRPADNVWQEFIELVKNVRRILSSKENAQEKARELVC